MASLSHYITSPFAPPQTRLIILSGALCLKHALLLFICWEEWYCHFSTWNNRPEVTVQRWIAVKELFSTFTHQKRRKNLRQLHVQRDLARRTNRRSANDKALTTQPETLLAHWHFPNFLDLRMLAADRITNQVKNGNREYSWPKIDTYSDHQSNVKLLNGSWVIQDRFLFSTNEGAQSHIWGDSAVKDWFSGVIHPLGFWLFFLICSEKGMWLCRVLFKPPQKVS